MQAATITRPPLVVQFPLTERAKIVVRRVKAIIARRWALLRHGMSVIATYWLGGERRHLNFSFGIQFGLPQSQGIDDDAD